MFTQHAKYWGIYYYVQLLGNISGVNGDPDQRGLIPRSAEHIFHHISQSENQQYLIHVTYIQIYQVSSKMELVDMNRVSDT